MTSFSIVNNSYSIIELHSQFPPLWITPGSQVSVLNRGLEYSKNPHKRARVLGVQADFVLIYRVFSAKSA